MTPQIEILHLVDGARRATGLTVIIDVCRAFTIAAVCFSQGTACIFPVASVEQALALRRRIPDALLMGEVGGRKPDQFDFGNSPSEVNGRSFAGRTFIQRTSAGTQGLVNAVHANEILTGAFVNAGAIARYIQSVRPKRVSLVSMGLESKRYCEEDMLCAEYLRHAIRGEHADYQTIVARIKRSATGDRFRDPQKPWLPPADLDICLALDRFDFVLKCTSGELGLCLTKVAMET